MFAAAKLFHLRNFSRSIVTIAIFQSFSGKAAACDTRSAKLETQSFSSDQKTVLSVCP